MRSLGLPSLVALITSLSAPAMADWVTLQDGHILRGIDLVPDRRSSGVFRFTLENGDVVRLRSHDIFHVEKEPHDTTVQFRGDPVRLKAKVKTLQEERQAREKEISSDFLAWAGGSSKASSAERRFSSLTQDEQSSHLLKALVGGSARVQALAAREIRHFGLDTTTEGSIDDTGAQTNPAGAAKQSARAIWVHDALARAATSSPYRLVRDSALQSLMHLREARGSDDPLTARVTDTLTAALTNANPAVRTYAANALSVLPSQRAVGPLIDTLHYAWVGFGRGYFQQITQRAYVADYELVSGGTGFSIIEVADPVIRTNLEGVSLDIDVRRVELIARLRALRKNTGQDFGTDIERWRKWLQSTGP